MGEHPYHQTLGQTLMLEDRACRFDYFNSMFKTLQERKVMYLAQKYINVDMFMIVEVSGNKLINISEETITLMINLSCILLYKIKSR